MSEYQKLFYEWQSLPMDCYGLSSVVQNEGTMLTETELLDWASKS